ncbi:MAG: prepilin-type N-terminal cleavage/methylation domain-containing protein [Planctomycetota bacterium]
MNGKRKGLSLPELLLVALIVGIMAAIGIVALQIATVNKMQADSVGRLLATNLRMTRQFAITDAAVNVQGYALKMAGTTHYYGYQIIDLSDKSIVDSQTIDPKIICTGDSIFKFGPLGNLLSGSGTQLQLVSGSKIYTITIISGTGAVEFSEN